MKLSRVLIANRGEIAVRLIRTCKKLGITAIVVSTADDGDALHVRLADETYALDGEGARGYLDVENIIRICTAHAVQAVLPGYGFLSENADFALKLQTAGVLFIGPDVQTLLDFGLKHTARDLALQADVPVVPGTPMICSVDEAHVAAARLGYPVMVKATAGGGGMGMQPCYAAANLTDVVATVQSRGSALFHDAGFFLEKYVESGRHIEAQIFGNGLGDVLFLGERECSVQRRHQKVVEETPSPFVLRNPALRQRLREASTKLAASVRYKSAGTVEFLVDDATGDFYFLEMNTRLQVEHGVTELAFGVDLVEMMLLQADAELQGLRGLSRDILYSRFSRDDAPTGHAIEVRLYAENPAKDYRPEPGLLQLVRFPELPGLRVDTWVETGTTISSSFDPLLAKILIHAGDRHKAIEGLVKALHQTKLCGPPTNLDFLAQVLESDDFVAGNTTTNMLAKNFSYSPTALEFVEPGAYTTIQDYPGRVGIPNGVPPSGPMDSLSFRVANILVGNPAGMEGFEITMMGPTIQFFGLAVIALCGAAFSFTINGKPAARWARHVLPPNSRIVISDVEQGQGGARAYLAIRGGLPGIADYLGSKATTPSVGWGGYQGRCMRAGDFLFLDAKAGQESSGLPSVSLPPVLIPAIGNSKCLKLFALPGPWFSNDYITTSGGQEHIFSSKWTYSHNSSRTGIRLEGVSPAWARTDGGDGGSHPSNMVGYGVCPGAVSWTGDAGVIITQDGQNQTGFIVTHTIASADLWRMGQLRPGDALGFQPISWEQAAALEQKLENYIAFIARYIDDASSTTGTKSQLEALDWKIDTSKEDALGDGVLFSRPETPSRPSLCIRQQGYRALLCIFGPGTYEIKLRARIQQVANAIRKNTPPGLQSGCIAENCSILFFFDPTIISQKNAVQAFLAVERDNLSGQLANTIPSRIIHLPALFDAKECDDAVAKYMLLLRDHAAYLPDNIDFIRRSNGLPTRTSVRDAFFGVEHLVNAVGVVSGLPLYGPIDPRHQLVVPKYNPARTWTRAGSLGSGGTTSSIYPTDGPGGYMLWGLTLPGCCWDTYGRRKHSHPGSMPWLFEPFDRIIFHEVGRAEFDDIARQWSAGMYEIRIEPGEFNLTAYDQLIRDSADEVRAMRKVQQRYNQSELEREKQLYTEWIAAKKKAEDESVTQASAPQTGHSTCFDLSHA